MARMLTRMFTSLRVVLSFYATGHEEMTVEEIILGKGDYYPGLIPLVYAYLGHIGCDSDTMHTLDQVPAFDRLFLSCLPVLFKQPTAGKQACGFSDIFRVEGGWFEK